MTRRRTRFGAVAVAAALLCLSPASATTLIVSPLVDQTTREGARLEYRSIPFTAELIRSDDRRFMLAALEWRLQGGVRLTSRNPVLYSIAWFDGWAFSGRLRDGRAIVILPHTFGSAPVTEIRTARTPELAGGPPGRAAPTQRTPPLPEIPGYRHVMSQSLPATGAFLGLWQRIRGPDDTLVVYFRPASNNRYPREPGIGTAMHRIVGRLPLRLISLFIDSPVHSLFWNVNITSQARLNRPIYILHYRWMLCPFQPFSECVRDRAASR